MKGASQPTRDVGLRSTVIRANETPIPDLVVSHMPCNTDQMEMTDIPTEDKVVCTLVETSQPADECSTIGAGYKIATWGY
jgi:hypothetical protein